MITEELQLNFQNYRFYIFVGVFAFTLGLQLLLPYFKGNNPAIFDNWQLNLPLGLVNSILISGLYERTMIDLTATSELTNSALLSQWIPGLLPQIILSVLILDLFTYIWHRVNHIFDFLWRFHSVHHSDTLIDSSSALRFHPIEVFISLGVRILIIWFLGIPLIGLFVFEVIYLFFNFVEHSHVSINKKFEHYLGYIFVTPSIHRWHHSDKYIEANSNYGTIFSIWDRMLKTYQEPTNINRIEVGLPGNKDTKLTLFNLFLMPFRSQK